MKKTLGKKEIKRLLIIAGVGLILILIGIKILLEHFDIF